jgi:glutaredoxin
MLEVFSSKSCIPCYILKEWLKKNGYKFREISIDTPAGYYYARKFKIEVVPTIKIGNKKIVGLPVDEKKLRKLIESAKNDLAMS